jgi:hypothetical protein
LLRRRGVHVAASAFYRQLICLVSEAEEFGVNNVANEGFVAGDGFNVYQLTSEGDDIHGKEHSALGCARTQQFCETEQTTSLQIVRHRDVLGNVWPWLGELDCYSV